MSKCCMCHQHLEYGDGLTYHGFTSCETHYDGMVDRVDSWRADAFETDTQELHGVDEPAPTMGWR